MKLCIELDTLVLLLLAALVDLGQHLIDLDFLRGLPRMARLGAFLGAFVLSFRQWYGRGLSDEVARRVIDTDPRLTIVLQSSLAESLRRGS